MQNLEYVKQKTGYNIHTFKSDDFYLKKYYDWSPEYLETHTKRVNNFFPGYILDTGVEEDYVWSKLKVIPGIMAAEFDQDDDFIYRILNFCIKNYHQTYPYAHMEWSLKNILIDEQDNIQLCDWDSYGIYPPKMVWKEMHRAFFVMFGKKIDDFLQKKYTGPES